MQNLKVMRIKMRNSKMNQKIQNIQHSVVVAYIAFLQLKL